MQQFPFITRAMKLLFIQPITMISVVLQKQQEKVCIDGRNSFFGGVICFDMFVVIFLSSSSSSFCDVTRCFGR